MILFRGPVRGSEKVDKFDKFVFAAFPCFLFCSFLLISLPYPFDDPTLGPQTSATVYGCTDCARDKGTAR